MNGVILAQTRAGQGLWKMSGAIDNNYILSVHHLGSHRCLHPLLILFKVSKIVLSQMKIIVRHIKLCQEAPIKIQPTAISLIYYPVNCLIAFGLNISQIVENNMQT